MPLKAPTTTHQPYHLILLTAQLTDQREANPTAPCGMVLPIAMDMPVQRICLTAHPTEANFVNLFLFLPHLSTNPCPRATHLLLHLLHQADPPPMPEIRPFSHPHMGGWGSERPKTFQPLLRLRIQDQIPRNSQRSLTLTLLQDIFLVSHLPQRRVVQYFMTKPIFQRGLNMSPPVDFPLCPRTHKAFLCPK